MKDKINLFQLQKNVHLMMKLNIKYDLGAKAKFTTPIEKIKFIDCSGFIRWNIYHATENHIQIPDGSWIQRDWLLKQSSIPGSVIHRVNDYDTVNKDSDKLYIATMNPMGKKAGHIWFVNDGFTMESWGGSGPDERLWNTPILRREVDFVFVWEHVWKM